MADQPIALGLQSYVDEIGALAVAISAITESAGGLNEERTRAVYSLACMAIVAWRHLDEAPDKAVAQR